MLAKIVLHCFLISLLTVVNCEEQWQIEERQILCTAKQENLPIIAVFVGGQWCPWSQKLIRDVLKESSFQETVAKDAILWEIALEKESQDHAMRQKYGIKECPQIVLLDPKGKEFARLGYTPLSAKAYADEILQLVDHFQEICLALSSSQMPFREVVWRDLYLKAQKLSVPYFKQVLLEQGLKKEKGTFFHFEKLAILLEKHKAKNPIIVKLKQEVLRRDAQNQRGTQFKLACLEFQQAALHFTPKHRIERTLKPLLRYLHFFGKKDVDHAWKAEMMIAEFLFSKNAVAKAIEHAQAALDLAPNAVKGQIAETLSFMQRT